MCRIFKTGLLALKFVSTVLGGGKIKAAAVTKDLISSGSVWTDRKNPIELTLEEIMNLYEIEKIDFLKIDIEGFEYDVLESLSPSILSRIDKISCEAHDPERNKKLFLPGKIKNTFLYNEGGWIQEFQEPC